MNTAIITLRMSNTLRTAILAASLTVACFANAPAGTQKSEDHFRSTTKIELGGQGNQPGAKSAEAIQPALLTSPRDADREQTPQILAQTCHTCTARSPWQMFLAIIRWS